MPRYTTEYFDWLNLDDYLSYVLKQEGSERFFAWEIEKGVAKCSGFRYVPFKTERELRFMVIALSVIFFLKMQKVPLVMPLEHCAYQALGVLTIRVCAEDNKLMT